MNNIVPKVSIIIPAYNAEKYIKRCLDSVVAQTMPDFECIIVDDGSTDRTGAIADNYARNDPRFKVIHQPNGGVSVARQTGIDVATGVYTIQFDADDWTEPNILEELVFIADLKDADMVLCDVVRITNNGEIYEHQRPLSLEPEIVFGQLLQPQLEAGLWNKLIKRQCYKRYNIQFIPDMKVCEDQYFCLRLLSHPIIVQYVPKALYHYDLTQNPKSLSSPGIPPAAKIRPLELIARTTNISKIRVFYDSAILFSAYEALFFSTKDCPNYTELFKKHLPSIRRAKGFPFRVKLLVILRLYGIRVPIVSIKKMLGKI